MASRAVTSDSIYNVVCAFLWLFLRTSREAGFHGATNGVESSAPLTSMLSVHGGSSAAEENVGSQQAAPNNVGGSRSENPIRIDEAISSMPPSGSSLSVAPEPPSLLGPNSPPPGWLRKQLPSFPWHRLPNFLMYVQCLAIPALTILFYMPTIKLRHGNIYSGSLFALASMTDWLDGYLARRWDITSPFGAFLDPVADKLMVSTSLILLAGQFGAVVALPALIILAREIAVSALREWMAQRGQRDVVEVGMQGKVKTALTMVALTVLLFVPSNDTPASSLFS
jgi:CDP-diacylglycerol--glycerol-3-phosphate 3-phosphatidyltransferase